MPTAKSRALRESRQVQALELRLAGMEYRAIGRQLNISEAQAFRDVKAMMAQYCGEAAESLRHTEAARLERLTLAHWPNALADVDSARLILNIMERRAKLLGLDAPTKIDIGSEVARYAAEYGIPYEEAVRIVGTITEDMSAGAGVRGGQLLLGPGRAARENPRLDALREKRQGKPRNRRRARAGAAPTRTAAADAPVPPHGTADLDGSGGDVAQSGALSELTEEGGNSSDAHQDEDTQDGTRNGAVATEGGGADSGADNGAHDADAGTHGDAHSADGQEQDGASASGPDSDGPDASDSDAQEPIG